MDWLDEFPSLSRKSLRELNKVIDTAYRNFSRSYGEQIEDFFDPLLQFLIWLEKLLLATPWPIIIIVLAALSWFASRKWTVVTGVVISLLLIGFFGMWENTMRTLSIITVCTLVSIALGLPIGILMARSDRVQSAITPVLDVMQTMPSFVYLIPVVMLLGIGKVPGVIAVVIYAIPPMIRLTNLGIRQVDKAVLEASEASDAFGATGWQKLRRVQLPLALPSIFAGVNQTIMMSLAMVVIASMIGVKGLGQPVLKAITNQYFSMGLFNGLAIVALAIIFDRVSQNYGKRLQKHRSGGLR
ncbi:proline/glycine betaine ABC transporter permease [Granulosicoccaceae sp. 1_MG-2023]|nr:proline/glycine betaine ABC transporter permease [Granulosicoccaceae sp. 1_MG-2023]